MLILRNPNLIAFETIVQAGTVHAAAVELGLTQTAVTLRIQHLEKELGMTLFLRSRRGMSLTGEGEALLQLCLGQKELEGQFLSKVMGNERSEVPLTIVGPTSTIAGRVVDDCLKLYEKYPFLNLHFKTEDHLNLVEMLKRGHADLAVVQYDIVPNEMDSKVLRPEKFLLVCSAAWKGMRLREILETKRIIDFYESDQTTSNYLKSFGLDLKGLKSRIFINNNEALIKAIVAGIGFGTLTEAVAKPFIEDGQLIVLNQAKALENKMALVWYPRPAKQKYFEDLIRSIK
jgi:LysR family transcriptional regulator (chromosome initiation inhibitor)